MRVRLMNVVQNIRNKNLLPRSHATILRVIGVGKPPARTGRRVQWYVHWGQGWDLPQRDLEPVSGSAKQTKTRWTVGTLMDRILQIAANA